MEPLEEQFTEFYRTIGRSYNLDDLTSRIYARLFIDPDEVAMEDLAKETGYSLASVSNKIKILEVGGMVERRTRPGTRKVFVYAPKDMMKLTLSLLIQYQNGEAAKVKAEVPAMIALLRGKKTGGRQKAQLEILEKYYADTLAFDRIITRLIGEIGQNEH